MDARKSPLTGSITAPSAPVRLDTNTRRVAGIGLPLPSTSYATLTSLSYSDRSTAAVGKSGDPGGTYAMLIGPPLRAISTVGAPSVEVPEPSGVSGTEYQREASYDHLQLPRPRKTRRYELGTADARGDAQGGQKRDLVLVGAAGFRLTEFVLVVPRGEQDAVRTERDTPSLFSPTLP